MQNAILRKYTEKERERYLEEYQNSVSGQQKGVLKPFKMSSTINIFGGIFNG